MRKVFQWGSFAFAMAALALPPAPLPAPQDDRTPISMDAPAAGKTRYLWFRLFLDKTTKGKFDFKDARGKVHVVERRQFHIQYMYLDGPPNCGKDRVFKLAEAAQDPRAAPGGGTWKSIGSGVYALGPSTSGMEQKIFESMKVEKNEGVDPMWTNRKVGDYVSFHWRGHQSFD